MRRCEFVDNEAGGHGGAIYSRKLGAFFCNPPSDDFTLNDDSPCAHPPQGCPPGGIGAHPVGCGPTSSAPESRIVAADWGRLKAMFSR